MHGDRINASTRLFEGWLSVDLLDAELCGHSVTRAIVQHPSGSAVLAFDPDRRVACITRQTRLPVLQTGHPPLAEAVGGAADDESPERTARRECLEETGIDLRCVEHVGHVWATPSTTTERVHLYLGEYGLADRTGQGGGALGEIEMLEVREEPLASLWYSAARGELTDAKLFMLLQALRIRRPDLFDPPPG
jgi:nudix-type nucleoside diphosphatase (YffH/AdpP family)